MKRANGIKLLSEAVLLSAMSMVWAAPGTVPNHTPNALGQEAKNFVAPEINARAKFSAIAVLVGGVLLASEWFRTRRKR